jgi:hypothetical protein
LRVTVAPASSRKPSPSRRSPCSRPRARPWGTVDDGLGLAEAERGELADDLDDLDLLVAGGLEDDVERVLLLLGLSGARATGSSDGDGGSSGDLELLLERLDEVVELDEVRPANCSSSSSVVSLAMMYLLDRWGVW